MIKRIIGGMEEWINGKMELMDKWMEISAVNLILWSL